MFSIEQLLFIVIFLCFLHSAKLDLHENVYSKGKDQTQTKEARCQKSEARFTSDCKEDSVKFYRRKTYNYTSSDLQSYPNCTFWNETAIKVTPICEEKTTDKSNLLVLMTSVNDAYNRRHIHRNTVKLWSQLGSKLQLFLYVSEPLTDKFIVDIACNSGFSVYVAPLCDGNKLPVLKAMFNVSQHMAPNASFYGFANGDILFDETLVETLEALVKYTTVLPNMMVIGRRTDIKVKENILFENTEQLRDLVSKTGALGGLAAVDMFITSKGGFPWHDIPKVVIGRKKYDNYLVIYANNHNVTTVDVTNTLLAAHQGGIEDYYASHLREDAMANVKVLGNFDYSKGYVTCARYRTEMTNDRSIRLYKVVKFGNPCSAEPGETMNVDFMLNKNGP